MQNQCTLSQLEIGMCFKEYEMMVTGNVSFLSVIIASLFFTVDCFETH